MLSRANPVIETTLKKYSTAQITLIAEKLVLQHLKRLTVNNKQRKIIN